MIANRPDWTLSRQRQWGVPMAFFIHKETGELHPRTLELLEIIAQRVEQEGLEAWHKIDEAALETLLGADAQHYEKNKDTLDVWFDSGTTHWHVLRGVAKETLQFPADLYLEGSDQHRGWFHSSLLTGTMLDGRPPYKALLTHGFTVDGQGRKMSKSVGNVVAPQEVANKLGAEIIRLWVASTDYSGELCVSDEILKRVVESYRRIRNTVRFLLANLSDYDHAQHQLAIEEWQDIDRYAVALAAQLQSEILGCFDRYEFHPAVALLQTFCSEDLGGFYLDILKDRLYTCAPHSKERRSAQNALYHITQALLRLMAPFLSFTAEEAWQIFSPNQDTIFTEIFYTFPTDNTAPLLLERWKKIRNVRANVTKALEEARVAGVIGSSLQAEVLIKVSTESYQILKDLGEALHFVLITSAAQVLAVQDPAQEAIEVRASSYQKCERCWHYCEDVGHHAEHPTLCQRCISNVAQFEVTE